MHEDDIVGRIRKLIRLSHSDNEHEAAAAAAMAQELLSKYNLKMEAKRRLSCLCLHLSTVRRVKLWRLDVNAKPAPAAPGAGRRAIPGLMSKSKQRGSHV